MGKGSSEVAREKPSAETRKQYARSRITNGRELLPGIDQRSTWARRMRDLIKLHVDDIGGLEVTSEAQRSLIRRIAVLEVEAEYLETAFAQRNASGKQYDLYLRIAGLLKRLYELIGIERVARDITPHLKDYLAATQGGDSGGP